MAINGAKTSIQIRPGTNQRANQTQAADFRISKIAVPNPAHTPAARMAFVPPVRPLSMLRISFPVLNFTINKPDGIDPSTYETASTNIDNTSSMSNSTSNYSRAEPEKIIFTLHR
jgi:hypothetical protein